MPHRLKPTVESIAKANPPRIANPKGHSILKEALSRERNLLRQMSASGYNMYALAETIKKRPPVPLARPEPPPKPLPGSRASSSDSMYSTASRRSLTPLLILRAQGKTTIQKY
jgi:hypothetical protein